MAKDPEDMDLPGYRLHRLRGNLRGFWSITVSGNWRIVFRFDGGNAFDIDLIDYHHRLEGQDQILLLSFNVTDHVAER